MGNTWRCPECETINTDKKCVVCGTKRTSFDNQEDDMSNDGTSFNIKKIEKKNKFFTNNITNRWRFVAILLMGIAAVLVGLVIGFVSALSNENGNDTIIPILISYEEYYPSVAIFLKIF